MRKIKLITTLSICAVMASSLYACNSSVKTTKKNQFTVMPATDSVDSGELSENTGLEIPGINDDESDNDTEEMLEEKKNKK